MPFPAFRAHRRFKGYDYSRGAAFFITFGLAPRRPLFGTVSGDKVLHSPILQANNPLKWSLTHGSNPPLKVVEPLVSPLLPDDEWWTGVGATGLLGGKLAAIRLSRKIAPGEIPAVVARCLTAAEKGFTPVSTFISPAEQALKLALGERGAPMVRVVPDPLFAVYRPKEDEPGQFAAGRLLLLSRAVGSGDGRSTAWHSLNDAIAGMAIAGGGTALYVARERPGAPLEWRFRTGAG